MYSRREEVRNGIYTLGMVLGGISVGFFSSFVMDALRTIM